MRTKAFFYVCAGLLCLALAYHLGAQSAGAQSPSQPVGLAVAANFCGTGSPSVVVITAKGEVYHRQVATCAALGGGAPVLMGNFWNP